MRAQRINQSIVIRVALRKECYQHILISVNDNLEDLADAIVRAFDFDNDHPHAFFLDNKIDSPKDCYYIAEAADFYGARSTCDYSIHQVGLKKGDAFKFLFDFGDNWTFQCKVLRVEEEDTKRPKVIRSVGKAPEQYPDYEDF